MRFLFIKPKHIGDSLLLTPTLVAVKEAYPQAEIWVVVRRGCEGILAGCPAIDRILTVTGVDKQDRRWSDLFLEAATWSRLLAVKFEAVFELGDGHRARRLAFLARTKQRYSVRPAEQFKAAEEKKFKAISGFDWKYTHRVEKDYRTVAGFLSLPAEIPPLCFHRSRAQVWGPARRMETFAVLHVGSRQGGNLWPREKWLETGQRLIERFGQVIISTGPVQKEVEEAVWLEQQLGKGALATQGKATWPEMADLLYRASILVTINTAMMHLAAACQCPTVAIFGPTMEEFWRPWKVPHRVVVQRDYVPVNDLAERFDRIRQRTAALVTVEDVLAAAGELTPQLAL